MSNLLKVSARQAEYSGMNRSSGSHRKLSMVVSAISLVALGLIGAGGAGAAAKGGTLKYAGSASGAKMTIEGPSSGKGYPKSFTLKVSGTAQCGIGGGVKEPLPFTYERTEKVYPVPSHHGDVPGFEINSELEPPGAEGEPGDSAEFPAADKELFITGSFVKKGKEASVHITAVVPVHGSQFGVSAPVLLCRLQTRVMLERVG